MSNPGKSEDAEIVIDILGTFSSSSSHCGEFGCQSPCTQNTYLVAGSGVAAT
jgi:hypothetical protein